MSLNKYQNFLDNLGNTSLNIAVDCVLFSVISGRLKVLINSFQPGLSYMLPGGAIFNHETSDIAANRILFERTGVKNIFLQQFKTFTDPKRFSFESITEELKHENISLPSNVDFPERVITIGYFALVNFNEVHTTGGVLSEENIWTEVNSVPELLYDHNLIITEALEALRKELFFKPIGYNLLPEKFTMPELQRIYEIILDRPLTRSNFQRKMLNWGIYERLEERKEGVSHKRPFLYRFNREKYEEATKQGTNFGF
nr:NUDIX hydrolase [uncultured Draconibacterium sp.]